MSQTELGLFKTVGDMEIASGTSGDDHVPRFVIKFSKTENMKSTFFHAPEEVDISRLVKIFKEIDKTTKGSVKWVCIECGEEVNQVGTPHKCAECGNPKFEKWDSEYGKNTGQSKNVLVSAYDAGDELSLKISDLTTDKAEKFRDVNDKLPEIIEVLEVIQENFQQFTGEE